MGLMTTDIDDSMAGLHQVELGNIVDKAQQSPSRGNPNTIVKGHYTTRGGHTVTISAIENPSGLHGYGKITGPVYVNMEFSIACLNEVGNRATVGGRISSIELAEEFSYLPIDTDWIIYFAVEDNGEGSNSDPDRYHAQLYFGMPEFPLFCDLFDPTEPLVWEDHRWFDVVGRRDKIKIK